MPNNYFQFKEFLIHQEQSAMKVSTDACIQGAFFAEILSKYFKNKKFSLLDIGTGTGLLSLMIAQKNPSTNITSLEINENAFEEAEKNFQLSKWKQQISLHHVALQNFSRQEKYDAIICNPPFFKNHLKSNIQERSVARHEEYLDKDTLANKCASLIKNDGLICVMYPLSEWKECQEKFKEMGLNLHIKLSVKPNPNKNINRIIGIFSFQEKELMEEEIMIYEDSTTYTSKMKYLLKDYYLFF